MLHFSFFSNGLIPSKSFLFLLLCSIFIPATYSSLEAEHLLVIEGDLEEIDDCLQTFTTTDATPSNDSRWNAYTGSTADLDIYDSSKAERPLSKEVDSYETVKDLDLSTEHLDLFSFTEAAINPTVTAYAIQPSCTDGVPNSDGYLQISAAVDATHYNVTTGSTYTGSTDIADATAFDATTDLPLQFNNGLPNPTGSQDYTIRVFNGVDNCFTDVVVTMNEQDCTIGCNCQDYVYLNDDFNTNDQIHKFSVDSSTGALTEIGNPLIDNITNPHGITSDINGNLYFTELQTGPLRTERVYKADCNGNIISSTVFSDEILNGDIGVTTNMASVGNTIYMNDSFNSTEARINALDACSDMLLGTIVLSDVNSQAWGFSVGLDDFLYATSDRGQTQIIHQVYKIDPDLANFTTPPTTINPLFSFDVSAYPGQANGGRVAGIITDENQNIYVVTSEAFNKSTTIIKFDQAGNVLGSISDTNNNGTGFYGAIGITYSEESGLLYITSLEDCVTVIDPTTMTLVPNLAIAGGQGKGLTTITACCPINNNTTVDTTLCAASVNDIILLQELINCFDAICEGSWEEGGSNSGLTFDACNNSIEIINPTACGTFTLSSDGSSPNAQCGAFVITVNIEVESVVAPIITATQPTCSNDNDPPAITVSGGSSTSTVSYQWQQSTTDCNTDFVDIAGATTDSYDPPTLSQDTYYRLVTSVTGCSGGTCSDTSVCVALTPEDLPEATISSTTNPTCGENTGTITFTFIDNPNRTNIEFSLDGGANYPYNTLDDVGSFTVSDLAAGTYDLWIRWGNADCPEDLPDVTLVDPIGPAACFGISITRN